MRTTLVLKIHAPARIFIRLFHTLAILCLALRKSSRQTAAAMLGLILLLATSRSVSAANLTWTGAVNGNWDTTTLNWLNGSTATAFHTGDNVTFDNTASTFTVTIVSTVAPGSVLVNNNSGFNYSFGGAGIAANGGLTKSGTGTLTLATVNTYTGTTLINGGTLALSGSGSISGSALIAVASGTTLDAHGRSDGTLTVASGQTLAGNGSVSGVVTVASGAVVAPGTSAIGTLTLNSNLNLAGNVLVKLNGSTLQNDLITGVNHLSYDGTLIVSNLGGGLASGESFALFSSSSFSGNFTSIVGSPGSGLAFGFDPSSGVLSISNVPAASSVNFWVNAVQPSLLCVHFDQVVGSTTAGDPANYTLYTKGGSTVSITNAVVQADQQSVALYLDNSAGEFFAVSANNIVTNALGSNVTVNATGYLGNFTSTVIGTSADPSPAGQVLSIFGDTFNVTSGGSDIGGTDDHCQFVYQQVVGDFDVAAQVTDIQATDPESKAGLMAREFLTPGSRAIGIYATALALGAHTSQLLMLQRTSSNGVASAFAPTNTLDFLPWLRVTRINNTFTTYYASNGLSWQPTGSNTLTLNNTLYIGLAGTSHTNGDTSTATFTGFGVNGARPGDGVKPSVSVYFYNKTNLIVKWQRTPRDFTVQIGQSLINTLTNSGGGTTTESNATVWAFLMLPVYDTALTGTNAVVPTPGRYMNIPSYLFTNQSIFIRLAQVDRVIPDPPGVTPGIIFSQASGSLKSAPVSLTTLCTTPVVFSNSVASTNVPILCPSTPINKYSYQFTTTPSGSTYNTILSVRHFPAIGASNCDTAFSAGAGKAQLILTPTNSNTGYTFVAAPTTPINLDCPIKVQVNIFTNY